ncbi:hypothetical protein SAMN06265182_0111 [Persephonella hydrogeniphila]|uniref:Uncharacterized protein n=1 Tax=Persephonella hydrogeniphila TaxID=198703 RepID=A0A285MYV8_9AQUI|nr:hypothetical protein [Persephonella hydrogeniphila]SNZ02400.1 hypothetical protein SAMN06265182_0111 [Persephonella hydrogeniphila]
MGVLTKIWFYFVLATVLIISFFISMFVFLAVLLIISITIPFALYLNWKAKKELEKMYYRDRIKEDLKKLR